MRQLPGCVAFALACLLADGRGTASDAGQRGGSSPRVENPQAAHSPATNIRLRVSVRDRAGLPLPGAKATIFRATPPRTNAPRGDGRIAVSKAGETPVATADGVIETKPLPLKSAYGLEVSAPGFAPELSRWSHPQDSGTVDLPPVQLRRLVPVKGTIVNRQRQPIAGVTVIQSGNGFRRSETVNDRSGRFVLGEVPEGQVVVCFEAAGYRFFGALLPASSASADPVQIELERVGDPQPRRLRRLPVASTEWSAARRTLEANKLLEPLVAEVLAKKEISQGDFPVLAAASRMDPDRILRRINDLKFAERSSKTMVRNAAGFALLRRGEVQRVFELISTFENPQMRIAAYLYWFRDDDSKRQDPATRRMALAKALALIRDVKDPFSRAYYLCEAASQLWDLGDHDEARKLLGECRKRFHEFPADNPNRDSLRSVLSIALSRDSAKEAISLAAGLEPGSALRLAAEISRLHPKEAESFLDSVPAELTLLQLRDVARSLPRLCSRLARHAPAAAERVLLKYARPPQAKDEGESVFGVSGGLFGSMFPKEFIDFQIVRVKAGSYGLMAAAAAKQQPAAAREFLLKAVDLLKPLRAGFVHPMSQFYESPAVLMALLVPVAERFDPALAHEIFWRALSLRIDLAGESQDRQMLDVDTAQLADLVRFYDRSLAMHALDPVLSRTDLRSYSGMPTYVWAIRSLALMDAERAISFSSSLSASPAWSGGSSRNSARQFIAGLLTTPALWDVECGRRLDAELENVRLIYDVSPGSDRDG